MGNLRFIASANTNSGSTSSPITFNNISSSYSDLLLLVSAKNNTGGNEGIGYMWINNIQTTNYIGQTARGSGITVTASSQTGLGGIEFYVPASNNSTQFSNSMFYLQNYTGSTYLKNVTVTSNSTPSSSNNRTTDEGSYRSNVSNAVTRLDFSSGNQWLQYSTFYLYGIDWTP